MTPDRRPPIRMPFGTHPPGALLRAAISVAATLVAGPVEAIVGPLQAPVLDVEFVDAEAYAFTDDDRAFITEVATTTLAEVAEMLPTLPDHVELTVQAGDAVIPETGDGGSALAPGRIAWTVDPGRAGGVEAIVRARLRPTLYHELHHLARGWTIQGGTVGTRIIDAAVSEGMATAFERDAAGVEPPWAVYPDDVDGWVDELRSAGGFAEYAKWMFEHPDGRRWIGYRAGTYVADLAMAASNRSAAELVSTPTDEVLELAGLTPPVPAPRGAMTTTRTTGGAECGRPAARRSITTTSLPRP
ncbi:MAG: DUF2268 domain-containing putative Zn-dependent protease [Gemmatimonadota bacterium]|nr:DUF2268 domain-containing putative Zn-dependent protease [Gemmatimonadota bacterium]